MLFMFVLNTNVLHVLVTVYVLYCVLLAHTSIHTHTHTTTTTTTTTTKQQHNAGTASNEGGGDPGVSSQTDQCGVHAVRLGVV